MQKKHSVKDKDMLHIVGIVGVPGSYGGFETLATYLLESPTIQKLGIVVFCETAIAKQQNYEFKGARLDPICFRANGWQSVLFDTMGLWKASFRGGVILVLGTSATFWLPLLRLVFPSNCFIVNMAGLEWNRAKWGLLARTFLRLNERAAVKHANILIADNQGLVHYVRETYSRQPTFIAYGGDQHQYVKEDVSIFEEYDLPDSYDFAMARAQIDNNVELILAAYSTSVHPLVFVSNWNSSRFGREMLKKYSNFQNLYLIGPVYDPEKVKALHQRARLYVHGHSAGGTNPVLVEAMWSSLPVLAFDVSFNRFTMHDMGFYFRSSVELHNFVDTIASADLKECGRLLRGLAERCYCWSSIRQDYERLILENIR